MTHLIQINYAAILAAVLLNMAAGFLWYGPLFGKIWEKESGMDKKKKPEGLRLFVSMLLMIIGSFLTAYVLFHSAQIWRPSVWNVGQDMENWKYGFFAGFFSWLGFQIPLLFNGISFENKSWNLFFINSGFQFVSL